MRQVVGGGGSKHPEVREQERGERYHLSGGALPSRAGRRLIAVVEASKRLGIRPSGSEQLRVGLGIAWLHSPINAQVRFL
jgi:hypothetical protein